MVSPAGESGDPAMQFTLWLPTSRLPESRSVTDTLMHAGMHTDASQPRVSSRQMDLNGTRHPR